MSDNQYIPFIDLHHSPEFSHMLYEAFYEVLDSGRFIGGGEVEAFEKEWAEYCGAKYCVGVGNGHDALMLACRYFKTLGEDVYTAYVPWKTCLPTYAAVRNAGLYPDPTPGCEHDLSVAVHIYGKVEIPNYDIHKFLVEDCAQAHGAKYHGKMAGSFGEVAAWSFYPTKNLGALGDAGAITTNNLGIANYVREMSTYGTRDKLGINSRLDPMQAAFLRVKLPYLDTFNEMRADNAYIYQNAIYEDSIVHLPYDGLFDESCWHQFVIETERRDELMSYLAKHGVQTMIHYPEPPFPTDYDVEPVYSLATNWTKQALSLPVAPHVNTHQCLFISELINRWIDETIKGVHE